MNTITNSSKTDEIAFYKKQLSKNPFWMLKALYVLYSFQTDSEKSEERTLEINGVGFTGADSAFLSSLATRMLNKGFNPDKLKEYNSLFLFFTEKQIVHLSKKLPKYARQLLSVKKDS